MLIYVIEYKDFMKQVYCILAVLASLTGMASSSAYAQDWGYDMMKAVELIEDGDVAGAKGLIEKHLEESPKDADAYMLRGQVCLYEERLGAALSDFNEALKYSAKDDFFEKYSKYWWRATVYSQLDRVEDALEDLETAYRFARKERRPECNDILSVRAQIYYENGDYDSSDADYRQMLANDETSLEAMMGLARNAIAEGRCEDAVKLSDEAEKYDAGYGEIYRFRMQAYDKLGQTDKAIDDAVSYFEYSESPSFDLMEPILKKHLSYSLAKINEKIANKSDDRYWRLFKAEVCMYGHDYAGAIREYDIVENKYGANANVCYSRSYCYNELGNGAKAVEDITRAMELYGEEDYYLLSIRADYLSDAGRYEEAIEDISKAMEISPVSAYPYYRRGWCYELMGDDEKAMQDYNAGIDLDRSCPYIYLMRGEQYLKHGDNQAAEADFKVVLQKDTIPENGSCRHYALHFLGKDTEALEWMEKIIASDPDESGNYYDKACLMARMDRLPEALEALKTALDKGYRHFAHIENDDDMDPLRVLPGFEPLIAEYRKDMEEACVLPDSDAAQQPEQRISEIQMRKMYSGIYEVDCAVNGLPLKFIFDTGASTVSISSVEATFMLKNGYLKEKDIKGTNYYSTATGEIREGTVINLPEVRVGDVVLKNIEASVSHSQQAPLLLGQSVLERFGTVTIDNINSKLIIKTFGD